MCQLSEDSEVMCIPVYYNGVRVYVVVLQRACVLVECGCVQVYQSPRAPVGVRCRRGLCLTNTSPHEAMSRISVGLFFSTLKFVEFSPLLAYSSPKSHHPSPLFFFISPS
jgi:hypothetical protein